MRRFLSPLPTGLLVAGLLVGTTPAFAASGPATPSAKPVRKSVLPFIADDLDRALAEAKRRDLPLFIESWAPW